MALTKIISELIEDNAIVYTKLGAEFTTTSVVATSDVDFSSSAVFTKTLTGADTFTYSNTKIGDVKTFVVTPATYALTLPGKKIAGTYSTTDVNFIQVEVTNTGEYWYSISQEIS